MQQKCIFSLTTQQDSITTHIHFNHGLKELSQFIKTLSYSSYVIITHPYIAQIYGRGLVENMQKEQCDVMMLTVSSGESYKTRETIHYLQDCLLKEGCDRKTLIIALGGGVIIDIAGFLASTTLRGLSWIAIPTTLLAMVDASIGGKTGVNTSIGKNLIGALHHPLAVWIDVHFLETLPKAEWINGFAEIIKYGAILDEPLFSFLESYKHTSNESIEYLIKKSCQHKINIVAQDSQEHSIRALLNFGHTIGHAIEQACEYIISHGEAVALGMVVEGYMSIKHGFSKQAFQRLYKLIRYYQFSLRLPKIPSWSSWVKLLKTDKKAIGKMPCCILLKEIGTAQSSDGHYCFLLSEEEMLKGYNWMCKEFS